MVAVLEVVEAHAVRDGLGLSHVLEDQVLQTGRPQRPVLLEHPVLPDQLVAAGRAVVPGVDAGADPVVLLTAHLRLDHVGGPIEADGAVACERAAGVEEAELALDARNTHRRGLAELRPLAAVPVFPLHHQIRAAFRAWNYRGFHQLGLDADAGLGGREQLLVAEVERAVELGLLAEGMEALALIDGQEDVVADVGERALRRHALAEDLDPQGDAVQLHRRGILEGLGELAANPERLDAVHQLLLDPGMAAEAQAARVAFGAVHRHVAPPLAVEVLPLGDGRHPRSRGSGHRLEEEVHGGLLVEGVQPVVTEIEEALHFLHAREERLARLPRGERFGMVRHRGAVAARCPHHPHREQRDVAQRFEGDRIRSSRLEGGDLRALLHQQLALRPFAGRELQHNPGRLRRLEADADQVEEGEEILLRHLVEAVDDHLRHPGVELEQGDARIRLVVIGPLRTVARDEAHGLVHDLLPRAVVEVRNRQGHGGSSEEA